MYVKHFERKKALFEMCNINKPFLICQLQPLQLETYSHQIIMALTLAAEILHCHKTDLFLRSYKAIFTFVAPSRFGSFALRFPDMAQSGTYILQRCMKIALVKKTQVILKHKHSYLIKHRANLISLLQEVVILK